MSTDADILRLARSGRPEAGRARLEPGGPVTAGAYGTWRLAYTVGARGVATGGRIRIDTDSDSDWGWPQIDAPAGPDYLTVAAPAGAEVAVCLKDHLSLLLVVTGRPLARGETVTVTYGDRRGGGPGSRAQTFVEERRRFWVEVDEKGTGEFVPLPDPPHLAIVGGPASRLVVLAPSQAVVDEPFRLLLKWEDEWGNPATRFSAPVRLSAAGLDLPSGLLAPGEGHGGVRTVEGVRARQAGVQRITARDAEGHVVARSNPVVVSAEPPSARMYWGDPHGGQVADPQRIGDFLGYARDVSGVDFVGFQRNDHVMTNEAYGLQQRYEREYYAPGRFVPLPGYEWSGQLEYGGHHNVYFRRFDRPIRRSDHWGEVDRADVEADLRHVLDLYQAYRQGDVVITPHVGGVHADLTYHDPTLEPAVEITSTHGTFEWFLHEALERKYQVGVVGGSDCFTGRPGDDRPGWQLRRYAKAGLTCIHATELTLEALLAGFKARSCYATTGARIVADVVVDGHGMGSTYVTDRAPELHVTVHGTAPIEKVEVYRGLDLIYDHDLPRRPAAGRLRVLWEGASRRSSYSGLIWDGRIRIGQGRVRNVERIRFDSPRSTVSVEDDADCRWHSWTCGYRSGLVIEGAWAPEARIELAVSCSMMTLARYGGHGELHPSRISIAPAERVRLDLALADLSVEPRVINLGPLARRLSIGLAPEPGPETVHFSLRDSSVMPGVNPYWIRVIQSDMEMAWTSPVFVDHAADPRQA